MTFHKSSKDESIKLDAMYVEFLTFFELHEPGYALTLVSRFICEFAILKGIGKEEFISTLSIMWDHYKDIMEKMND